MTAIHFVRIASADNSVVAAALDKAGQIWLRTLDAVTERLTWKRLATPPNVKRWVDVQLVLRGDRGYQLLGLIAIDSTGSLWRRDAKLIFKNDGRSVESWTPITVALADFEEGER